MDDEKADELIDAMKELNNTIKFSLNSMEAVFKAMMDKLVQATNPS